MTIEGEKSSYRPVKSGVPQGTVLGPVLFIVYVADLQARIRHSKVGTFADDTKLSKGITGEHSESQLQEDLERVAEWSLANSMSLHEDKFEVIHYTLHKPEALKEFRNLPFTLDLRYYSTPKANIISPTSDVRDLGVIQSNDGSFTSQISKMTKDARRIAGWTLRTFKDRSATTMLTLYKSLVRCRLEFCSPVWNPHGAKGEIKSLESVQRSFTRKITDMKQYNYWQRLEKLQLKSLQRRRERYTLIHTWKIYNEVAPGKDTLIHFHTNRLGVRAVIPSPISNAQGWWKTKYHQSFGMRAAVLWNTLPKKVNMVDDLDQFKALLGQWLDQFPDRPPVTGYPSQNTNSIEDWVKVRRVEGGMCE